MAKELLKRNEVKKEFTWNLEDLYADIPSWENAVREIQEIASRLEQMEGKVTESA